MEYDLESTKGEIENMIEEEREERSAQNQVLHFFITFCCLPPRKKEKGRKFYWNHSAIISHERWKNKTYDAVLTFNNGPYFFICLKGSVLRLKKVNDTIAGIKKKPIGLG